jgi:hypothetical protein
MQFQPGGLKIRETTYFEVLFYVLQDPLGVIVDKVCFDNTELSAATTRPWRRPCETEAYMRAMHREAGSIQAPTNGMCLWATVSYRACAFDVAQASGGGGKDQSLRASAAKESAATATA